jgi:hypothetical protein
VKAAARSGGRALVLRHGGQVRNGVDESAHRVLVVADRDDEHEVAVVDALDGDTCFGIQPVGSFVTGDAQTSQIHGDLGFIEPGRSGT